MTETISSSAGAASAGVPGDLGRTYRAGRRQAGLMLALRWNMLSGSYSALIAASLSYLAGP